MDVRARFFLYFLSCSFIFFLGLGTFSQAERANSSYYDTSRFAGPVTGPQLSLAAVEEALAQKKFNSVETFLAWVEKEFPAHLRHYTLAHQSDSLQEASPEDPRVLAFGPDAKLIFTFNGSPEQKGFERVEFMEFKDSRKGEAPLSRFDFRELIPRDGALALSEVNPARCMQCHTTSRVPIFEQYDFWENFYGQEDDTIFDLSEKYARIHEDSKINKRKLLENERYQKFQKLQPHHARYRYLKPPEGSPVSPYSRVYRNGDYRFRPNLALTKALSEYNTLRIVDEMLSRPEATQMLAPLLLHYTQFCGKPGSEETAIRNQASRTAFLAAQRLYGSFATEGSSEKSEGEADVKAAYQEFGGVYSNRPLLPVALLWGFGKEEWTMSRKGKHWTFFEGQFYHEDQVAALLAKRLGFTVASNASSDSIYLNESFDGEPRTSQEELNCQRIAEKLKLTTQTRFEPERFIDWQTKGQAVLKTCQSCHSTGEEDAPFLDLAHPTEALKEKILARIDPSASSSEQMPPLRKLTRVEHKAFIDLIGLSSAR